MKISTELRFFKIQFCQTQCPSHVLNTNKKERSKVRCSVEGKRSLFQNAQFLDRLTTPLVEFHWTASRSRRLRPPKWPTPWTRSPSPRKATTWAFWTSWTTWRTRRRPACPPPNRRRPDASPARPRRRRRPSSSPPPPPPLQPPHLPQAGFLFRPFTRQRWSFVSSIERCFSASNPFPTRNRPFFKFYLVVPSLTKFELLLLGFI